MPGRKRAVGATDRTAARHPPAERPSAIPALLKPLIDGVVCAFQTHQDPSTINEASTRIATGTGLERGRVRQALANDDRAFRGPQHRLVSLRGDSVRWAPCDHLCVAGDVPIGEPSPGLAFSSVGE